MGVTASASSAPAGATSDALVQRLARLDSCIVSDAMDALGVAGGGVVTGVQRLWGGGRIAGSIHTVRLAAAGEASAASPGVHLGARAIEACSPGEIIVVASQGRTDAGAWGGLLSAAARERGVQGVVIDGACRDVDEAAELGFAVFARAATPVSARGRNVEVATDETVDVAGTSASPGDFIVADGTGVVIVPADEAEAVAAKAEDLVSREQAMLVELRSGTPVSTVLGRRYEQMLLRDDVSPSSENEEAR